jgi:hypothetical protein
VLWERTSGKGNKYLSGYLGKAKLVGFCGEPTADGTPTWDIYLQPGKEQEQAEAERKAAPSRPARPQRQQPQRQRQPGPDPDRPFFSDEIDDIGRRDQ